MFGGARVPRFVAIEGVAMRKLAMLNQAGRLGDLGVPPGNRLEALRGRRAGRHTGSGPPVRERHSLRPVREDTQGRPVHSQVLHEAP